MSWRSRRISPVTCRHPDGGVDFITIDGGEGGTGAGPLVFTDHVALPFKMAFGRVHRIFDAAGISENVVFAGSGKLGFPQNALLAFAMGCDMINVGREAMIAIGCIQAQRCHTNHCPNGVATQSRWLAGGLDPRSKAVRVATYIVALRKDLLRLACACGVPTRVRFVQISSIFWTTGSVRRRSPKCSDVV